LPSAAWSIYFLMRHSIFPEMSPTISPESFVRLLPRSEEETSCQQLPRKSFLQLTHVLNRTYLRLFNSTPGLASISRRLPCIRSGCEGYCTYFCLEPYNCNMDFESVAACCARRYTGLYKLPTVLTFHLKGPYINPVSGKEILSHSRFFSPTRS
jgi:hypothetical protein